jgi:secondary thiamine-phosphate synthase enzyme
MHRLAVKTHKKREIIDITQKLEAILWKHYADKTGICQLNLLHTTAALATADLDPGTDLDMLDAFEIMVPKLDYRHEHNPEHVPDHILSAMIGCSLGLAVEAGLLLLGTWQRVILIEFDGPRERELVMSLAETS